MIVMKRFRDRRRVIFFSQIIRLDVKDALMITKIEHIDSPFKYTYIAAMFWNMLSKL